MYLQTRKTLIRRVAVASRSERQHLPQPLAGGREQIDELEARWGPYCRCRNRPPARSDGAQPLERGHVPCARSQVGAASAARSLSHEAAVRAVASPRLARPPERDRQSQHERAKRDRERRQHDRTGQSQLLERHHDADRDDEDAQRAAQQAGARQPGIHRGQQRGAPEKIADQEAEREHQQRDQKAGRT